MGGVRPGWIFDPVPRTASRDTRMSCSREHGGQWRGEPFPRGGLLEFNGQKAMPTVSGR
jgi:hypothetical protein